MHFLVRALHYRSLLVSLCLFSCVSECFAARSLVRSLVHSRSQCPPCSFLHEFLRKFIHRIFSPAYPDVGLISAALSGPVYVPPDQRLVIEPNPGAFPYVFPVGMVIVSLKFGLTQIFILNLKSHVVSRNTIRAYLQKRIYLLSSDFFIFRQKWATSDRLKIRLSEMGSAFGERGSTFSTSSQTYMH